MLVGRSGPRLRALPVSAFLKLLFGNPLELLMSLVLMPQREISSGNAPGAAGIGICFLTMK